MNDFVVYFAHGKESGPWGTKIVRMAEIAKAQGFQVESPDYSTMMNPQDRVQTLLNLKPSAQKGLVLVGSSMGGYVSTVASAEIQPTGLFLLAPAFYRTGYQHQNPSPQAKITTIVHGWQDEIIPVEDSIRYAREHHARLYLLHGDHRLVSVLPQIESLFAGFLEEIKTLSNS